MTKPITLFVFIVVALLVIFLNKPESGREQEINRLKEKHKAEMDSVVRLCE